MERVRRERVWRRRRDRAAIQAAMRREIQRRRWRCTAAIDAAAIDAAAIDAAARQAD
jgi:hypothetical protein